MNAFFSMFRSHGFFPPESGSVVGVDEANEIRPLKTWVSVLDIVVYGWEKSAAQRMCGCGGPWLSRCSGSLKDGWHPALPNRKAYAYNCQQQLTKSVTTVKPFMKPVLHHSLHFIYLEIKLLRLLPGTSLNFLKDHSWSPDLRLGTTGIPGSLKERVKRVFARGNIYHTMTST